MSPMIERIRREKRDYIFDLIGMIGLGLIMIAGFYIVCRYGFYFIELK